MYLKRIQQRIEMAPKSNAPCQLADVDADTFVCAASLEAAVMAAGVVCHGVDIVMNPSDVNRSFCCIRPPGHHAGRRGGALGECGQGFCLINNIALGIGHARQRYPSIKRVCIVDIDVHHGNGTEEIFKHDEEAIDLLSHIISLIQSF